MGAKIGCVIFAKTGFMNIIKDGFLISTEKEKLDLDFIHSFLVGSYWAKGISREIVARSIDGSICFVVFDQEKQIGFARMITDKATFAYLADVFIAEQYRGRGLSKWLMEVIMSYPELQGLRRMMLATRDAHGLYAQFGFTPLTYTERWMQIHRPDVYNQKV
jgi:N-acetylglutamate synthase-like GNAT family acetyltransferase